MIKLHTVAVALFALPLIAGAQTLTPVDETGYQKLVQSQKGSIVMIDFWATYCKPCRAEMPQLVKLQQKLAAKGVRLLTVSADEPEAEARAKQFLKEAGVVGGPAYWKRAQDDDKFFTGVDPKWDGAMPALFLYDKSGKKARSFFGESPLSEVEAAIQKLL